MTPKEQQELDAIQAFRPTRVIATFNDVPVGPEDLIVKERDGWHVVTHPIKPFITNESVLIFWQSGRLAVSVVTAEYSHYCQIETTKVAEPAKPKVWTRKEWLKVNPFSV